ncbi:MAG: tRNA uridine-5-carboxymethylaminomethyl(34) synthesis enzyme MnmG, partial [Alphaproteobacteria bacterium]|nr:tRNA uridine-5-carboxymethylaminomethyl(34) synthesis enzyme MnmG [Alphaproteobacteria bacterium]
MGCVGAERQKAFSEKMQTLAHAMTLMTGLKASPNKLCSKGVHVNADGVVRSALELISHANITISELKTVWPELEQIPSQIATQLEIEGKYAGYLDRQEIDIRAFQKDESLALPADLDVEAIGSLSTEIKQKLKQVRPETLGAAARIPGVTPAAVIALLRYVKRKESIIE